MHEAGIAQGLMDAAVAACPDGKVRITKLVVSAGVLSGVEKECLAMYVEALTKDTPHEGVTLELNVAPAFTVCRACGLRTSYDGRGPVEVVCAQCGGNNGLEGGREEIILESIEAVKEDA
jgi:hydrogenase nickel incorporation protein HypA/HybF